jgi:hypothetical protein
VSEATIEVLTGPAFFTGIIAGATALVIGWLAYLLFTEGKRPSRAGGFVLTVAAVAAIAVVDQIPSGAVLGIAFLAVAGWLPLPVIFSPLLALPGAMLLAFDGGITSADWVPWFIIVAIVLAAPLVASFDRAYAPTGIPFPMYALAVVGLFFTVPDTEVAVVLLGTALAGTFLGWPKPLFALGRGGAFALVGLFVWVAGTGGSARPVTVIVAVACLGPSPWGAGSPSPWARSFRIERSIPSSFWSRNSPSCSCSPGSSRTSPMHGLRRRPPPRFSA